MAATNTKPSRRPLRSKLRWTLALEPSALAAVLLLVAANGVSALDQPVAGRKLWLKTTPKFILLSKDAAIDVGGANPRCSGAESSLVIGGVTFLLPCANWTANGSGTFKYRNPDAPAGASAVKIVRIKNGQLKVIGKGLGGLVVPNGEATIDVVLNLDGITHRYCMSFPGEGDGVGFVAKDAPAGSCPSPLPCEATTGGFCWFLGADDVTCDAVCAIAGRAYDSATETYAGSGGSDANCIAVLDALGVPSGR